jgi:hypothetical protein
MRWLHRGCLLGLLLLLGLMPDAYGKMYKWTDRQGKAHFTDNLSAIPPEYRDQVEERPSAPSNPKPSNSVPAPRPAAPPLSPQVTVPLHREGNSWLVDVVFNRTVSLRMVVDTGAEWTLIPVAAARQLTPSLEEAPVLFISGAVGSAQALVPLLKIKSMAIGEAVARDVEVVAYDSGASTAQAQGLLGATFLEEFQVTLDPRAGQLILVPLTDSAGESLYGGRPEAWWRRKFRYLRGQIETLDNYLKKRQSDYTTIGILRPSQSKFTRTLQYYQAELRNLEHKASLASVPNKWRYE